MKVTVCDVEKKEGKLRTAKYRTGFNRGTKLDLCDEHKDFAKQFKNDAELTKWLYGFA